LAGERRSSSSRGSGPRGRQRMRLIPQKAGRRTESKQNCVKPVKSENVDVPVLLEKGKTKHLPSKGKRRRRHWLSMFTSSRHKREKDELVEDPSWTNVRPTWLTSEMLLPQPLPRNFDQAEMEEELRKAKKKEEAMEEIQWKRVDVIAETKRKYDRVKLPRYVRPELLEQYQNLLKEEEELDSEEHPEMAALLLQSLSEEPSQAQEALRRQNLRYESDRSIVEGRFKKEVAIHNKKMDGRRAEIKSWLLEDLEERQRSGQVEAEIAALDFYGSSCAPTPSSKKHLRSGRPPVSAVPVDYVPEPTPEVPKKRTKPTVIQPISYLLSESGIYRDLRRLGKLDLLHGRAVTTHKVSLDNQKLTYEGKSYPRGQPLFIQTEAFPWFSVIILSLNDGWVQFRSTIPGDTRCVTATIEDLEAGRVLVSKLAR
ncbi:hypothetical protein PFISCL1PPCAC_26690, partial [Pristionchus fissidentatus]